MIICSFSVFLNLFVSMLALGTTNVISAGERKRVILAFPDHIHPLRALRNRKDANIAILMHTQNTKWVAANLTHSDIKNLASIISVSKGVIGDNDAIVLSDTKTLKDSAALIRDDIYLTDVPLCNSTLNGVDFVVIDTIAFRNIAEFENANIVYGPFFTSGQVPCHPHAAEVISTIVGKTTGVIPTGDRRIYNIATFDCDGTSFPETIIKSFNAALQFAKLNAQNGRRTVVNFSGTGGLNPPLNLAANALANAGIPVFVALGNDGVNACLSQSPASAKGVFAVGATASPGNVPADFTNFGSKCTGMFLPGKDVTVVNVNGGTKKVDGTSFGSPIAAALGGLELGLDSLATPPQVFARISSGPRTQMVIPVAGSSFFSPMKVMLTANACPETRIFNLVTAVKSQGNKLSTWFNALKNGTFCVTFSAQTTQGPLLIGLRVNDTVPGIIRVKIGDFKNTQGKFANTLQQYGANLNATNTDRNLLKNKMARIFRVNHIDGNIAVESVTPFGVATTLLFSKVKHQPQEIAFSSLGGGVKYTNGIRCTI